jgi:hypothetical protein
VRKLSHCITAVKRLLIGYRGLAGVELWGVGECYLEKIVMVYYMFCGVRGVKRGLVRGS